MMHAEHEHRIVGYGRAYGKIGAPMRTFLLDGWFELIDEIADTDSYSAIVRSSETGREFFVDSENVFSDWRTEKAKTPE